MTRGIIFTPDDVASALRTMTAAQRRAVSAGRIGKGYARGAGYWPLRNALYAAGLFCSADRKDVLTPLGREVQLKMPAAAEPVLDTLVDSDGGDGA